MTQSLQIFLAKEPVRFTPEGKLFVFDAIAAVAQTEAPVSLWEKCKAEHPRVDQYCDYLSTTEKTAEPVCDSEGWNMIQEVLFDYMIGVAADKATGDDS